jgi:hypothetical protein
VFQQNAFQNDVTGPIKGFQVLAGVPPAALGGGGFVQTFSRRRWREFMLAYDAEMRAIMDLQGSRTIPQQDAIRAAKDAAEKALLAVVDAAETEKLNADLVRLANALDAALGSKKVAYSIKRANAAIAASEAIIAEAKRQEQEEEDDMIAILWTLH